MGQYALQIEPDKSAHDGVDPKKRAHAPTKSHRRLSGRIVLLAATVVAVGLVGGSLVYARQKHQSDNQKAFNVDRVLTRNVTIPPAAGNREFTAATIKQYDGKAGHKCYVAVSGTVYEIPQTGQWQQGQHAPSNGQAYCGADMTAAIGQSPHGTSKLNELPKVGTYK